MKGDLKLFRTVGVASRCSVRVCVCRGYRLIWNLGLQIAGEWLNECCHVVFSCASKDAGWRRDVAKRIVMAAWVLHELRFGR